MQFESFEPMTGVSFDATFPFLLCIVTLIDLAAAAAAAPVLACLHVHRSCIGLLFLPSLPRYRTDHESDQRKL